ncbi:MAG: DUF4101 domain-containing protein [Hormoscilla sp. GUM202]|nr:DUF4101 domain-containing protein [Hormoscilla sp. GUM202]
MRIPLDYYRILGLPIQATVEQLEMAHRDRTMQLPRREYSEIAIDSRKQLLDRAYGVLSDSDQRRTYDANLDAALAAPDPKIDGTTSAKAVEKHHSPSIEISEEQLVGALLILLELGEYELVLQLGRPYLSSSKISAEKDPNSQRRGPGACEKSGASQLERSDTVLTIAHACLELGREQWQQGNYTTAAEYLETGQNLLLSEGLFPTVRGEITADIYKLRPYRIMELLAQSEEKTSSTLASPTGRRQGVQMLRDMLEERGGIDGTGDDGSGLGIDDFLRFVQQLRSYMTSEEQQTLFESEALRPSAVATYLAVYALLARGFAQHKPALINRAKRMLMRLGNRQDVHLEQAVCALLLGQTSEASRALELSQEYEQIAFIREHSQGAPDLLPGLCLYGENWLYEEVFTHFQDLQKGCTTLKDYFADKQVQTYLEALPQEINNSSEWTVVQHQQISQRSAQSVRWVENGEITDPVGAPTLVAQTQSRTTLSPEAEATAVANDRPKTAPAASPGAASPGSATRTTQETQRATTRGTQRVGSRLSPGRSHALPTLRDAKQPAVKGEFYSPRFRMLLLAAVGIVSLLLLWFVVGWLLRLIFTQKPVLEGEQLQVRLAEPPIQIPDPNTNTRGTISSINKTIASQAIDSWLTTKRLVFGPNHSIDRLEQILVEPALGEQRRRALVARQENWYGRYQHRVEKVSLMSSDRDRAIVEAIVSEKADFFVNGRFDRASSYFNPNLRLRYELINQAGQWRIQNIILVNN